MAEVPELMADRKIMINTQFHTNASHERVLEMMTNGVVIIMPEK